MKDNQRNAKAWCEMYRSKEWIKPTKQALSAFLPILDDGTNDYIAIIGKDEEGQFTLVLTCFNLQDGWEQIEHFNAKGFLPIRQAAQLFPNFFEFEQDHNRGNTKCVE